MQEVIQRDRKYHVKTEYDVNVVRKIAKKSGSKSIRNADSTLSWAKWAGKEKFWFILVDEVAFLGGIFSKHHFRLIEFGVEKEFQKQGYGTLCMELLYYECAKRNVNKITLKTAVDESAYQWYLNRGAQIISVKDNHYEMEFIL